MESNKPLSVHMTHEEYEQYKKYLKLSESNPNKVFCLIKKEYFLGYSRIIKKDFYSESEMAELIPKLMQEKVDYLEKQIEVIENRRRWYNLWS